jgi:hypothetical protein
MEAMNSCSTTAKEKKVNITVLTLPFMKCLLIELHLSPISAIIYLKGHGTAGSHL